MTETRAAPRTRPLQMGGLTDKRASTLAMLALSGALDTDYYHRAIYTAAMKMVAMGMGDKHYTTQWGSGTTVWGLGKESEAVILTFQIGDTAHYIVDQWEAGYDEWPNDYLHNCVYEDAMAITREPRKSAILTAILPGPMTIWKVYGLDDYDRTFIFTHEPAPLDETD